MSNVSPTFFQSSRRSIHIMRSLCSKNIDCLQKVCLSKIFFFLAHHYYKGFYNIALPETFLIEKREAKISKLS
jgi:hypothetical protein